MKGTLLSIMIFLIISCSTKTEYSFDIDVVSFIDEEKLSNPFIIPSSAFDAHIYLFPGVQVDLIGEGPRDDMRGGIVLSIPPQEIQNSKSSSLHISMGIKITNTSTDNKNINGDRISIYIAPLEIEDIYTDGIEIKLLDISVISPGESEIFEQDFELKEFEQLQEILRTGSLRFAMGVFLSASEESTEAVYSLEKLNVSFRFSLLDVLVDL